MCEHFDDIKIILRRGFLEINFNHYQVVLYSFRSAECLGSYMQKDLIFEGILQSK